MTCHPRESASRNRGTLLCISRNPKRTKADRTSFPERRGTFTRSIQQPLWHCEPRPLPRSVPDIDQSPREFPARPPLASCPGTNNFLAINIWPRKIHLPPSQPQLLSSPPHLIPHNPAVKPRQDRWRPSALPQTTKNYIPPAPYRTEQVQILTNLLQRSTRTDCGLCTIRSHRWPCSAHSISRGGTAVPIVLVRWPTIHQQHPRRVLG